MLGWSQGLGSNGTTSIRASRSRMPSSKLQWPPAERALAADVATIKVHASDWAGRRLARHHRTLLT